MTQASGSIGGVTASRNKGGMYMRGRAVPVNPNTPQQQTIRGAVASLSNLWSTLLTPAERDAWDVYAQNVLLPGPLGDPRQVSGLNMYTRSNTPRIQAGLPRVDAAPTTFDLGEYTAPSIGTIVPASNTVPIVFDNTDDWANENDAAMLVFIGRPQNPSINYFKGPYQLADQIDGDATTAPTSPFAVVSNFPFASGNKIFALITVTRADGRYSSKTYLEGLAP